LKAIDPMLRTHLSHTLGQRGDNPIAALHSSSIGRESFVFSEIMKIEGVGARAPLPVASDRDDERPIRCFEQLIGDEIRMGVSPSLRVIAGNENVLGDVDERGTRAVCQ
jgi:hypothetical protein